MNKLNKDKVSRIAVRVPNWIGDCVMNLAALKAIKAWAPHAHLAVIGRPWVKDLYAHVDCVDEILEYDKQGLHKGINGLHTFCKSLQKRDFDAIFLFQNAFGAGLMARLAGIEHRIGYARDGRGWLLTHPVPVPWDRITQEHEVHYYLNVLKHTCHDIEDHCKDDITLPVPDTKTRDTLYATFDLDPNKPLIGLAPGAAFGPAKRWPQSHFDVLSRRLSSRYNAQVIVLGSPDDAAHATAISGINLCGKTSLSQMISLVACCDGFVTNDSGPMHVAAAFDRPQVAIFGSTDDVRTGPYSRRAQVAKAPNIWCRPCRERKCRLGTYDCLHNITCDQVLKIIDTHWDLGGDSSKKTLIS